jgi:hypothetical protein
MLLYRKSPGLGRIRTKTGMRSCFPAIIMDEGPGVIPPSWRFSHNSTLEAPPNWAFRAETREPAHISRSILVIGYLKILIPVLFFTTDYTDFLRLITEIYQ